MNYSKKWKNFLNETKAHLPKETLERLVQKFAISQPYPKIAYVNFSSYDEEFDNSGGAYFPDKNLIAINLQDKEQNASTDEGLRTLVWTILHEIQHFNQRILWRKNVNYRMTLSNGKLPDGFDPVGLEHISSMDDLIQFWIKMFDYNERPHEIDAMDFADKNLQKGMSLVGKDLTKASKSSNVIK
jgi:hypothetical protein